MIIPVKLATTFFILFCFCGFVAFYIDNYETVLEDYEAHINLVAKACLVGMFVSIICAVWA